MGYAITKGFQLAKEGMNNATISNVEVLLNEEVIVKGKKKTSTIIQVDYQTASGKARGRYFFILTEDSSLGNLARAISGYVPDKIDDIEEFLMNAEVVIEVKHNTSRKTGRVFANVVNVYPLAQFKEDEEEYEIELDGEEQDDYLDIDLLEDIDLSDIE